MIYESVIDNISYLLRQVGYIKEEQLISFFSDVAKPDILKYHIKLKVRKHELDYNDATGIIKFHSSAAIKDYEIGRRVRAFWVVNSFRSSNK